MPRGMRKKSTTGIYHVLLRGINRQSIFLDDEDCEMFIQTLKYCKAHSEFELYAYCLMGNHAHLLLKEGKENLAQIFRRIGAKYVYWYNWKYRRCGHLFQDRYKSEVVESDPYFTVVLRYIHQNPIKAGLCKSIEEYRWSSYNGYLHRDGLVDHEFAMGIIGKNDFKEFIGEERGDRCMEYEDHNKKRSDMELAKEIEDRFMIRPPMIQNEPKENRNRILAAIIKMEGVSTRQLSRVTGVSANIIWKL